MEGLGNFLELKVVLIVGGLDEAGISVDKRDISRHQLVEEVYVSLLAKLPDKAIADLLLSSNEYKC